MEQNPDLRILVLARIWRDTELLCTALQRNGFACTALSSEGEIFDELKRVLHDWFFSLSPRSLGAARPRSPALST